MTVGTALRIGTRGSRLAMAQAEVLARALDPSGTDHASEIVELRTRGDAISARHPRGGFEATDGQFTAELERAVVAGRVEVAVHSYKDLPTASSADVVIVAILPRADARDCLLTSSGSGLAHLRPGATVGTGSARRDRQLRGARPDLRCRPIRGNVETRIRRMHEGEYDAVVLACAGLDRLGIAIPDAARLPFELMLPAPAQGALAVQVRADREDLRSLLAPLDHPPSRAAVEAERALLTAIGGGCLAPLGALGEVAGGELRLRATYIPDGADEPRRVDLSDTVDRAARLVEAAATRLETGRP